MSGFDDLGFKEHGSGEDFKSLGFAAHADAPAPSGVGQTALEHFGNGIAFGYLPHLQAAAEQGVDAVGNLKDQALGAVGLGKMASADYQLRNKGFDVPESNYVSARDENIQRLAKERADNPKTAAAAGLAGGAASAVATAGLLPETGGAATLAGKIGQSALQGAKIGVLYGAASNPGDKTGELSPLQLKDRVENAGKGGATGAVIGGAMPAAAALKSAVADGLKSFAEKSAVNATGATGKQASNFADDAGRELLDRGIVRFGDSQEKIAQRATEAVDAANKQIDSALAKLDQQGVKVDANAIYKSVRDKITALKTDPSQSDIAKILEGELDNLVSATDAKGSAAFSASEAEGVKRGYNRKAGNWADPEKSQAGKEMYQTYRGAVEDAATAADPATAKLFEEGKKTYGLLAPIEEAAQRRAATTAQSPAGGLADIGSAAVGLAKAGPVGAIAAPIARRLIAPRMASTLAVSADAAANVLRKIPQIAALEESQPAAFQTIISRMTQPSDASSVGLRAADQPPQKGPDKWANDGLNKLIEHSDTANDKDVLMKNKSSMLENPQAKNLLIAASDLSPGSKAMDKVLTRIKAVVDKDSK